MNCSKLRGRTRKLGYTQHEVAVAAAMSDSTYSLKLNGRSEFTLKEIMSIVSFLRIGEADVTAYFFTEEVQKTKQERIENT